MGEGVDTQIVASAYIRFTRSGRSAARAPTTKKVAFTPRAARMSKISSVQTDGPSSNVSTTCRSGIWAPAVAG